MLGTLNLSTNERQSIQKMSSDTKILNTPVSLFTDSSDTVLMSRNVLNTFGHEFNFSENKNYKNIFQKARLYFKYLSAIKTKLNNFDSNVNIKDQQTFIENYEYSVNLFEELSKEWFWISNCDTFKSFRHTNSYTELENHKKKIIENYLVLETISNYYGFDMWNCKRLRSNSQSNSQSSSQSNSESVSPSASTTTSSELQNNINELQNNINGEILQSQI
jgi:hypothetical protein